MITHIGQPNPRWDTAMPGTRRQQQGLGYAVTLASAQRMAGLKRLWVSAEGIGVVAHLITHGVIQANGLLTQISTGAAVTLGKRDDLGMITVDKPARLQILIHGKRSSANGPSV